MKFINFTSLKYSFFICLQNIHPLYSVSNISADCFKKINVTQHIIQMLTLNCSLVTALKGLLPFSYNYKHKTGTEITNKQQSCLNNIAEGFHYTCSNKYLTM
jgi:hypothetical protein